MGQETPQGTLPYPTTLEWGSAHDAPPMSWSVSSDRNPVVSSVYFIFSGREEGLVLHLCYLIYSVHTFFYRKRHLLKKRPHYPTCLPQLLPLNLHDLPSLVLKVGSLATGQAHPNVPGGSVKPSPSRQQQLLPQQWQQCRHQLIRVLLWMRRDLRARMVLNMATERVV